MTIIKICGIKNLDDAIAAIEAGADMLGFNFYPPSPRAISPKRCAQITSKLAQDFPHIIRVGVFVNLSSALVNRIINECFLDLAQLHGDETPAILAEINGNAFKAFRGIPSNNNCSEYLPTAINSHPAFLLDASGHDKYGGSGITADWNMAARLAREYPILLAGGLKPDNVAQAISQVQPWGVDTASGVEKLPGEKDETLMRNFVKTVRTATN